MARTRVSGVNPIVVANGERTVRFTPVTPELVRIEEIGPQQKFVDDPTYFAMNRGGSSKVERREGQVELDTGSMHLTFRPDGRPLHPGNLEVRGKNWRWDPAKPNDEQRNLGGGFRTQDLHGVGKEKNHHGGLQLDDGVISKQGFFCYDDSKGPVFRDGFPRQRTREEHGTDLYLFGYGRNYAAALRSLAEVSGSTPMPHGPMLGAIDSWWQPLTQAQYERRARSYLEHGYPIDAMAFDMEALKAINPANSWSRWSWNQHLIPDARGLNTYLHGMNVMTFLNLHPHGGVAKGERGYERFMNALRDNGYLRDHGYDQRGPAGGQTVQADFADPRYVGPWMDHVLKPLRDDGVNLFWLDYQPSQGKEMWRGPPEFTSIEGLPVGALLAHLLYHHAADDNLATGTVADRPAEEKQRGAILTRLEGPRGDRGTDPGHGFLGSHRYPMQFSGDTFVQFPILASQVRMTAASANVLASFWSHDIGGLLHEKEPELFARWTWFGALSACLRVHGFNAGARSGHDPQLETDCDPRPWRYGEQCAEATKRAYHLRSQLFPYIYSQVWNCHDQALPLIQPMYLSCPSQRQAYCNPQQYMFGESLLVAPIVREGHGPKKVASQAVWFPKGQWYHLLTGERYRGEDRVLVSGALDEVPVYAKGGVPIATQPVSLHMGSEQIHTLIVRAYPGADGVRGESVLHEDDRLTQAYREGGYASTKMSYLRSGERVTLELDATEGRFKGQPGEREYRFELPATGRAANIAVNGVPLEQMDGARHEYDEAARTNVITLPRSSIRRAIKLELDAREAPPAEAHERALAQRLAARFAEVDPNTPLREQIARRAKELPADFNAERDDRLRGLLELAGVGFETPESGPYGWSPYQTRVLQPFYGSQTQQLGGAGVLARDVQVIVEDKCGDSTVRVFDRRLAPTRSGRDNFPLPALESNGGKVERFVTMRFTVEGVPIRLARKVGETSTRRAFEPTNPDPHHPQRAHERDVTPDVTVNGFKVSETDRIGLVAGGEKSWVNQAIRDAVGRHRGPKGIGYPAEYYPGHGDVQARLAHRWCEGGRDFGVTLQNFNWGGDPAYGGECVVIHRDGAEKAYVIRGDFWRAYSRREGGACVGWKLGFPIADETIVDGKRTQLFESGSMVQDGVNVCIYPDPRTPSSRRG